MAEENCGCRYYNERVEFEETIPFPLGLAIPSKYIRKVIKEYLKCDNLTQCPDCKLKQETKE